MTAKRRYVLAFFQKPSTWLVGIEACASSHQLVGANSGLLHVYDKYWVPKDRRDIESLISAMQIGLMWANVELRHRGQALPLGAVVCQTGP